VAGTITLGRIAGIRISVNWSWVVVFALITWTLASGVFPAQNPGLSDTTYVAMAAVAAVLFFASLLLHELGHALQARRERLEIDGITLWLFGGVAQFKGELPSAGAELRIAVAGPAVSLVIGIACSLLALAAGLPEAADAVAAWLGYVNLALLVFNLMPALPLDGGRVLRSLLWLRTGDLSQATAVAGTAARAFAFLLIGGGIALFILDGAFSGAWLAFIGWFLLQASTAEVRWVLARQALDGLRARDLMTPSPVTVAPDLTLGRFVDEVVQHRRYTTYPVVADGKPVGLLPFRCVAQVPRERWDRETVRDCMLPLEEVPQLSVDDDAVEALAELQQSDVNRGLVVDGDALVGILSISDLASALEIRRLRGGRAQRGPGAA
jgi:Zn-dependent protease/CBS domain-containing protein